MKLMLRFRVLTVVMVGAMVAGGAVRARAEEAGVKSLAGAWGFEMDRGDVGVKEGWFGRGVEGSD